MVMGKAAHGVLAVEVLMDGKEQKFWVGDSGLGLVPPNPLVPLFSCVPGLDGPAQASTSTAVVFPF